MKMWIPKQKVEEDLKLEEYKKIREEAEKFSRDILKMIPENFTMIHLELVSKMLPRAIDDKLYHLKMKVKVNPIELQG